MLGIDNRGHRVRGCPSLTLPATGSPLRKRSGVPRAGRGKSDRVCDTSVLNIAGAELAEALVALCAPDFLDDGLGGDYSSAI